MQAHMDKLDRYDRALLTTLQENGRATNVELSAAANLSAPQCYRRVQRLETEGIIRSYSANVNPASVGFSVVAYVTVSIDRGEFKHIRKLESVIKDFPHVLECHTITGDFDYMLKVVARDLKSLSNFLTDQLMQVPGLSSVRSMVCLEEIKMAVGLPVNIDQ